MITGGALAADIVTIGSSARFVPDITSGRVLRGHRDRRQLAAERYPDRGAGLRLPRCLQLQIRASASMPYQIFWRFLCAGDRLMVLKSRRGARKNRPAGRACLPGRAIGQDRQDRIKQKIVLNPSTSQFVTDRIVETARAAAGRNASNGRDRPSWPAHRRDTFRNV